MNRFLRLSFGCLCVALVGCATDPQRNTPPVIHKLGTIDLDMVETTPVVWRGEVWRFEWVRQGIGQQYWANERQTNYFRFRNRESGAVTPPFADGHEFGSGYVEDGRAYVTGTLGRSRID